MFKLARLPTKWPRVPYGGPVTTVSSAESTINTDYMLAISYFVRHLYKNLHTMCFEATMAESITANYNCNGQDKTKSIRYGTNFGENRR
jgi:hypothetical protein